MANGSIPPPRRAAARSLTGTVPKVLPKEQYSSTLPSPTLPSHFSDRRSSGGSFNDVESIDSGNFHHEDMRRLNMALKEEKNKAARALRYTGELEEELARKNQLLEKTADELKVVRQNKHNVDSELAQSTADYMNSQTHWIEQVDSLNDEIQLLRTKLAQNQHTVDTQSKELTAFQEREAERQKEKRRQEFKANRPDNVEKSADKLEIHQGRLLIAELKSTHSRMRSELDEQKSLNKRLTETNNELRDEIDQYQFLLIEKTVSGEVNTAEKAGLLGEEEALDLGLMTDTITKSPSQGSPNDSEDNLAVPKRRNDQPVTQAPDSISTQDTSSQEPSHITSQSDQDSMTSTESTSVQQAALKRQQFELASLRNHNRALKTSLDSLVARLLEHKSFKQVLDDAVSPSTVDSFRRRVASNSSNDGPNIVAIRRPGAGPSILPISNSQDHVTVSTMIFNKNYTGSADKRAFSMGVDNEVKMVPPPDQTESPLEPQSTGETMKSQDISSSGNVKVQINRRSSSLGAQNSIYRSPAASVTSFEMPRDKTPARVDNITGLRKLRLLQ